MTNHTSPTTRRLFSTRAARVLDLLETIRDANDADPRVFPSKADLCRGRSTNSRAADYQRVDQLVRVGFVEQTMVGRAYELVVTDAGRIELAAHGR